MSSLKVNGSLVLEKKTLKGFPYIDMADLDYLNKFIFLQPLKVLLETWLQFGPVGERSYLKLSYYSSPGLKIKNCLDLLH